MREFFGLKSCLSIDKVFSAFHYQGPWNYAFRGEKHDFWELVYVNKGQLLITAEDRRFILKAGEVMFHQPNEFHALSAYDKSMPDYIVVSFSATGDCIDCLREGLFALTEEQQLYLHKVMEYSEKAIGDARTPQQHIGNETQQDDIPVLRQLLKNWLETLLLSLVEKKEAVDLYSRNITQLKNAENEDLLQQIITYVQAHIEEQITLSEISMALNFSITYLERVFREKMDCSILRYINSQKMLRAKQLLQSGKYSVKEVSIGVGFGTPQYFSRRFKKEYGITPTEFLEKETLAGKKE